MSITVCGYDLLNEADVLPVEIRCSTCGACAVIGERDYAVHLTELTSWAQAHECSRELRVT